MASPSPRARALAALVAGVTLLGAACSDAATGTSRPPANTASRPATTTTTTTSPTTTTATPASTTEPPVTTTMAAGAGAAGLGDPYFPGLGNGGYDVDHYTIELDVDPVANEIAGTTTIAAAATATLRSFNLDFSGLDVAGVTVDERPARFRRDGTELVVEPAAALAGGEAFVAAVTYSGTPEPTSIPGLGLSLGWQGGDGATFVVSEPSGAQTWYPVNDHPSDKATYTYRITVPAGYAVAANGVLAAVEDAGAATTYVWEVDQPMASYLATVIVDRLERFEDVGPGGTPIRHYFPDDVADGPRMFARTAEMMEFMESIAGPYPFDAYGIAIAGDFSAAIETQTLSLFGGGINAVSQAVVDRVAIHELAHQWYGDSVSPATWQDVWLNEGFATMFEWLWLEHVDGRARYDDIVASTHVLVVAEAMEPPADPGAESLLSGGVYLRGALTLAALRAEVGDEAFLATLRAFYDRFAYGNAATADFVAVASEVAGRDLAAFLAPWLYDPVAPPLPES